MRLDTLEKVKANIKVAQEKQKRIYDRKHNNPPHFAIGSLVLKKDFLRKKRAGGCLDHRWVGPYKITKDVGKGLYSINNIANKKVISRVHGVHLKIYNQVSESVKIMRMHSPL